ncbi:formylglycine-generating enzyme family protein [Haliscomenobacter sp.]|uniref:formylglycine-generating enzyme family protein n=1 Tax=Haliscomenobacter sp. TaxID=2717303 RepID=UPI0035944428
MFTKKLIPLSLAILPLFFNLITQGSHLGKFRPLTIELKASKSGVDKGPDQINPQDQCSEDSVKNYDFDMIKVKGGTFMMGCTDEQGTDCESDEKPAHQVTVKDFYIGKTEVTQAQWKQVTGSYRGCFTNCDEFPIKSISWYDTEDFIKKLNADTGKKYRLPTEAEWEYAARGGKESKGFKFSGSNNADEVAHHWDNAKDSPAHVGTKKPNELGIYDMSGNIAEWCQDEYRDYRDNLIVVPEWATPSQIFHVIRGGSHRHELEGCRTTSRFDLVSYGRYPNIGLRLALDL